MKKNYVLDANVLLHDPHAIFKFEDNNVIIPIYAIEEIDKFKRESTERGRNARTIARVLDGQRPQDGTLSSPVPMKGGGSLYPFSLIDSAMNVARLCFPFLPLVVYAVALSARRLVVSAERVRYGAVFVAVGSLCAAFAVWMGVTASEADPARGVVMRWCAALAAACLAGPWIAACVWRVPGSVRGAPPGRDDLEPVWSGERRREELARILREALDSGTESAQQFG